MTPTSQRVTADDLARLRAATGDVGGPMERHGLRCFLICEKLATDDGREVDRSITRSC